MDVCAGGTIRSGSNTITFTNDRNAVCTITSCTMPGFPVPTSIPAKQGSNPGSKTVNLSQPAQVGNYPYTADCCDVATGPAIKVD